MHPPAKDLGKYIELYARNFDLLTHIRFSTSVDYVERDEVGGKWHVFTHDTKSGAQSRLTFDRVVIATGMLNIKNEVKIKGIEKFAGDCMHSRQFKDPNKYQGKNVLVVGVGATGADTTSFLNKAGAEKIYLSHRAQYYLVSIYREISGSKLKDG